MAIVDEFNACITGGVDTHLDSHVAAALDVRGACWGLNSSGPGELVRRS